MGAAASADAQVLRLGRTCCSSGSCSDVPPELVDPRLAVRPARAAAPVEAVAVQIRAEDLIMPVADGYQEVELPDGSRYAGQFESGRRHGRGSHRATSGEVYSGQWAMGLRSGAGRLESADGSCWYEGQWVEDHKSGLGDEQTADSRYRGSFAKDRYSGYGTLTWSSQAAGAYKGDFRDGMICGKGEFAFPDGRIYVGEFMDNAFSGYGLMLWPDGRRYDGNFRSGKLHGKGKYCWPNGRVYEGQFKDGRQHGAGVYAESDGPSRSGVWDEGELQQWTNDEVPRPVPPPSRTLTPRARPPKLQAADEPEGAEAATAADAPARPDSPTSSRGASRIRVSTAGRLKTKRSGIADSSPRPPA